MNTPTIETSSAIAKPVVTPPTPDQGGAINVFASAANFGVAQRMAMGLASGNMVPEAYRAKTFDEQGRPNDALALGNCMIAIELASRIGCSVFMVMQNLDVIHGRPGFRAVFLIATVNASGRFTPLRFRWQGKEGEDSWGCRAVAKDRETDEECVGTLITIAMAKAEGWSAKNGSKWKTLPELMLQYRAAAFWTRVFAPEMSMGMQTAEEVADINGSSLPDLPTVLTHSSARVVEDALLGRPAAKPPTVEHDPLTGEIVPPAREPGVD